ncbi:MAG: hypothetical protein [Bacteriophage sp.]|mgnify:FL=1|jgi:hypothetical protein|uniref:Uncharacterized protein n=1 Tax=uncultured phage cr6_1 TaxID=2772085 RepID=A0A7M1RS92_9CAUD|nr:hypothetical protein [Romboutsia timonensis]YP_010112650.1 hypothetical protein KNV52_gp97 [uncultured phage cr6_1]MED9948552.1 hypothetical protein [Peptacetobacter hiranonis]UVX35236.1 MAG: hypothetical protein [Bacteriophage sp.]QOR57198.1 hypothetical protein [uncultured phage cr6_1]UVX77589.1 MAG: hypothetical protein [Bacteriophage sp.]
MNINKETMKKVLDLTKCNSTEEICDVLEKEIDNKQKANKAVKEASESLIEEYKKEAVAEPKKKGIIKRTIHWLKSLFKK